MIEAVFRFVPCPVREGSDAEVGAGEVLGRAKDFHAREGRPGTFASARFAVHAAEVAHAFAHQRERGGLSAHAAADDECIQQRLAVRARI